MAQGLWVFALQAPGIDKNTQHHVTICMMYDRLYVLVNSAWAVGACKLILRAYSKARLLQWRASSPLRATQQWVTEEDTPCPVLASECVAHTEDTPCPVLVSECAPHREDDPCSVLASEYGPPHTYIKQTNKKTPLIISTGTRRATRNRVGIYLNGRVLAYCR